MHLTPEMSAQLVERAAAGDRQAWNALVDAYEGLIWSITRSHRLRDGDACDVCQTVWLRLIEHIDRLSNPSRVGAWLVTTARRECLRVQAQSRRTIPVGEGDSLESRGVEDDLDTELLREETINEVRGALTRLPSRWQDLLAMLMADPSPSYDDVATSLDIPVGSIGPTRGRCLQKLRVMLEAPVA